MTNLEKVRQEIESRLRDYSEDTQFEIGKRRGYKNILAFIDSLPEDDHFRDSTKMVSENLEEAARRYSDGPECSWVGKSALEYAFIAGAKWQKAKDDEEREENKRKENELPRFYGD